MTSLRTDTSPAASGNGFTTIGSFSEMPCHQGMKPMRQTVTYHINTFKFSFLLNSKMGSSNQRESFNVYSCMMYPPILVSILSDHFPSICSDNPVSKPICDNV